VTYLRFSRSLLKFALDSNAFALAKTGGIIHEIKSLLNESLSFWRSSYCPRECNRVAHTVTVQGCLCSHDTALDWDDTPPSVEDVVASDSASPLG
jgi:hypothetical protein